MKKKFSEKEKITLISNSYIAIGVILIIIGTVIIILARYPQVWYSMNINSTENEFIALTQQLEEEKEEYKIKREEIEKKREERQKEIEEEAKKPPFDPSLPLENHILIEKIKLDTPILEGQEYDKLLEKGIWRVYDFGHPENDEIMILAGHRFGYFNWTQEQRDHHSFFHLPNTRIGDKIEIIWGQRKYEYEIYKTEEDTQITDYTADLILYTCKLYNSPIRIFRYAQRAN